MHDERPVMDRQRRTLPQLHERVSLGPDHLDVSPVCLGITREEDTVLRAYELGVNFFFLTADLQWPLYERTRRGLSKLFSVHPGSRERVVVAVASYLCEPLFGALQFQEVVDAVPGLGWIDVLVAGAVSCDSDCDSRALRLSVARARRHLGARSIGMTFHSRAHARRVMQRGELDVSFIRYNARHPGARADVFPFLQPERSIPLFGFNSTMFHVPEAQLMALGVFTAAWRPRVTDHYRFALTSPYIQGVLASPSSPGEIDALARALKAGPLSSDEEQFMMQLTATAYPHVPDPQNVDSFRQGC